jgi:multiple sugar transport system permease protein
MALDPAITEVPRPRPAARRRWSSSRLTEAQFAYLFVLPLAVVLLALIVYPVAGTLWQSLRDVNPSIGRDRFVGIDQYVRAFKDPAVIHALTTTVIYSVLVTVITSVISFGSAFLLNSAFVGRRVLTIIIVLPFALSTYATAVIWRFLYSPDFGFLNAALERIPGLDTPVSFLTPKWALLSVAVAHSWQLAPIGTYFILASLQVIPQDLYKTARADGLRTIGRFRHVTFPYIRYAILITLCIVTVEAARAFDIIYFLTGGGPGDSTRVLSYEIYAHSFMGFNFGYGAAISYILLFVISLITVLYFVLLYARRRSDA